MSAEIVKRTTILVSPFYAHFLKAISGLKDPIDWRRIKREIRKAELAAKADR